MEIDSGAFNTLLIKRCSATLVKDMHFELLNAYFAARRCLELKNVQVSSSIRAGNALEFALRRSNAVRHVNARSLSGQVPCLLISV